MTSLRRIQWAFALGGMVLLALAVFAIVTVVEYRETNVAIRETKRTQAQLMAILSTIKDLETGSRGYLLSGNTSFLAPYDRGLADLPDMLSELKDSRKPGDPLRVKLGNVQPIIANRLPKSRKYTASISIRAKAQPPPAWHRRTEKT